MELTIKEMLEILEAPLMGKASRIGVRKVRIQLDSRKVKPGEIFWALKGERFDAHDFLGQVAKRGVEMAVINESYASSKGEQVQAWIPVRDTEKALLRLAQGYARKFSIPKIAITGSNGKTTTKDMVHAILSGKLNGMATEGNFNNLIGVPLTLMRLNYTHKYAVVETGTNQPGEINQLSRAVAPSIALITNVGASHLEGLHSLENILKEKLSITNGLKKGGVLIVNADDAKLSRLRSTARYKVLTFGIRRGQLKPDEIHWDSKACASFRIGRTKFKLSVPGIHSLYNALAAISVGLQLKVPKKIMAERLEKFNAPSLRMDLQEASGFRVLADCYNANPASVKSALLTVGNMETKGKKIAVLGDMLELGKTSRDLHIEIGKFIPEANLDWLLTVGKDSKYLAGASIQEGMNRNRVRHFKTREELESFVETIVDEGDLLLVKASRGIGLENVVNRLMNLQIAGGSKND